MTRPRRRRRRLKGYAGDYVEEVLDFWLWAITLRWLLDDAL